MLSVGGLKEKLLAARREGIKTVVVPKLNEPDIVHDVRLFIIPRWDAIDDSVQVPDSVKEGLEIIYASDVRDVLRVAFRAYPELVERIDKLPLGPAMSLGNAGGVEQPSVQM